MSKSDALKLKTGDILIGKCSGAHYAVRDVKKLENNVMLYVQDMAHNIYFWVSCKPFRLGRFRPQ